MASRNPGVNAFRQIPGRYGKTQDVIPVPHHRRYDEPTFAFRSSSRLAVVGVAGVSADADHYR